MDRPICTNPTGSIYLISRARSRISNSQEMMKLMPKLKCQLLVLLVHLLGFKMIQRFRHFLPVQNFLNYLWQVGWIPLPDIFLVECQVTIWRSTSCSGMRWLLGRGMRKMKLVAYAGWLLTDAALTVSSLEMIARSFGVRATMLTIFTAYWSGSIPKHPHRSAPCAVGNGSLRDKAQWPSGDISAPSGFPCTKLECIVVTQF
jgi:hypothetical protein